MKEYKQKITKERLNSKEFIRKSEFIEDDNRARFYQLNKEGKSAVNKLINKASDFLKDVEEPTVVENNVLDVIDDVKNTKRLYFEEFVIINNYVISEEKSINNKVVDEDDDFILL